MRRRVGTGTEAIVADIHHCLGEGGKVWRTLSPAHGKGQRKGDEWCFTFQMRERDSKLGHVTGRNIYSVETIGDVNLQQVDGALGRVGKAELPKDSVQGVPKLHGFSGCQPCGLVVDERERVVDNRPWSAVTLGDDSHG